MLQSFLISTQTYVDQSQLQQQIAYEFLKVENFWLAKFDWSRDKNVQQEFWNQCLARNFVIVPEFSSPTLESDNRKRKFRDQLLGLYEHRTHKTIVFLGDLHLYSEELQEGMLKLLEEPPANTFLVLWTLDMTEVLPTIQSRCLQQTLSEAVALHMLDQELLEKTKSKLPPVQQTVHSLLKHEFTLPDLSKCERTEIDFWLWQITTYLKHVYMGQLDPLVARLLYSLLQARVLNNQNLQKKFALEPLLA